MEFSRQEYWSGLTFPAPRDLPDPEIELSSPALQADSLLLYHQGLVLGQSAPYSNDWDPYKRAIWTKTQGRRPYKDGGGDGSDTAASSGVAGDHQKPGWGTGVSQSLQKEETLLLCWIHSSRQQNCGRTHSYILAVSRTVCGHLLQQPYSTAVKKIPSTLTASHFHLPFYKWANRQRKTN